MKKFSMPEPLDLAALPSYSILGTRCCERCNHSCAYISNPTTGLIVSDMKLVARMSNASITGLRCQR